MSTANIHIWQKYEITLEAKNTYENPYTDVMVWVDFTGPNFKKRVYGFWDGGNLFRVRVAATEPGEWSWHSCSTPPDPGLCGERGRFTAVEWTDKEKAANACRRGFLRATSNGHAIQYADGTPCFLIGDTWWAGATFRHRWTEDIEGKPFGPGMGFKDMVQYRKAQGYNCIAMLAALPAWANDGKPPLIWFDEAQTIGIRDAWPQAGTPSAKAMHNEGGRPFLFPGRVPGHEDVVPDFDRINPPYFQEIDRKVDYLNAEGFILFIEVARRDISTAWRAFYDWPDSYVRYVQYLFSRYQANNVILSPIHYDWNRMSIPSRDFNEPANLVLSRYGPPPFGTPLSANSNGSTLLNFGQADWITFHQIGNWRDHNSHWLLTEIFRECDPSRPAFNGEPYYCGWEDYHYWFELHYAEEAALLPGDRSTTEFLGGTERDNAGARSGMYGSFLSGGLAGHVYGAQGLWGGDIEPESPYTMWDAFQWKSGAQMQHFRDFVWSEGARFQDLVPNADLVYPNKTPDTTSNQGWAYCARTPERDLFMLYFETGCAQPHLRSALPEAHYRAQWFNPRTGEWLDAGILTSDAWSRVELPTLPSGEDWAMKLVLQS